MGEIDDALTRAAANTATRPIPKSAGAQMRFLLKAEKGSTRTVAARLGVTQRTVERYLKGTLRRPRAELAGRLGREVRKDWQPRLQQRAKKQAATATGRICAAIAFSQRSRRQGGRASPLRRCEYLASRQ